jgi:hypothetical protein
MSVRSLGAALTAALALAQGSLPIRRAPRTVDPHFSRRVRLCPTAPDSANALLALLGNDSVQSIEQFLGPALIEVAVHQIGDSFPGFAAVEAHIRWVLAARPRSFFKYSPWAEGTPLRENGILGTLKYSNGATGSLEIAGLHVCAQDSLMRTWWIRVAPGDLRTP